MRARQAIINLYYPAGEGITGHRVTRHKAEPWAGKQRTRPIRIKVHDGIVSTGLGEKSFSGPGTIEPTE